eukprot:6366402-Pyramimonas_sp.AAC.1
MRARSSTRPAIMVHIASAAAWHAAVRARACGATAHPALIHCVTSSVTSDSVARWRQMAALRPLANDVPSCERNASSAS